MGRSTSISSTSYLNAPLQLDDNRGGVALAGNRDTQVGGLGNIAGSSSSGNVSSSNNTNFGFSGNASYSTLDGGAIDRAFDFGDNLVTILASLTKQNNAAQSSANSNFIGQTLANASNSQQPATATTNAQTGVKQYLTPKNIVIVGVLAAAYFWLKKGR